MSLVSRKLVALEGGSLVLRVPEDDDDEYSHVVNTVSEALVGIEALPVIPREVEDIMAITSVERHRWLKDGRLQSVGTRTVKLRGAHGRSRSMSSIHITLKTCWTVTWLRSGANRMLLLQRRAVVALRGKLR